MAIGRDSLDDSAALPRPADWARRRPFVGFIPWVAFLVVITVGLAVGAVSAFSTGHPGGGLLSAAAVVYLVHLLGLVFWIRWPRRRPGAPATLVANPQATTKGVRFAYSGWAYYWVIAFLVMTGLGGLMLAAAFATSATLLGIAAAIIIGGPGLVLAWYVVTVLRLAPGEVILSPAGVFHRGPTYLHFVPWYAVAGVTALWLGAPVLTVRAHPSDDTGIRRYMGWLGTGDLTYLPLMVIRVSWLATDPVVLYHALAFYHAHPDLRAELATPDAVERINSGRSVVGTET